VKLLVVIAAPFAVALTAMPAQAQDREVHSTSVTTRHVERDVHRDDQVAPHHGWHRHRVCKTRWSHHRRIRSCRNVRARW
jgi:hypothetical protein